MAPGRATSMEGMSRRNSELGRTDSDQAISSGRGTSFDDIIDIFPLLPKFPVSALAEYKPLRLLYRGENPTFHCIRKSAYDLIQQIPSNTSLGRTFQHRLVSVHLVSPWSRYCPYNSHGHWRTPHGPLPVKPGILRHMQHAQSAQDFGSAAILRQISNAQNIVQLKKAIPNITAVSVTILPTCHNIPRIDHIYYSHNPQHHDWFITPYIPGLLLSRFVYPGRHDDDLHPVFIVVVLLKLIDAVSWLHSLDPPIVHGAITLDNIIISEPLQALTQPGVTLIGIESCRQCVPGSSSTLQLMRTDCLAIVEVVRVLCTILSPEMVDMEEVRLLAE
ncbi:hypothetical protein M011DRAFT_338108 [Sporormia fimetaria CBS 119925]|uniref:Protein kinase domain-containing protein n=1 Tax=Sporormia fimetaria CBS 119925 TaxID=1340428 RepID=A0A6A6VI63_9PLEO|nr:hypothetical protein M011DRAFT_338108 [Sporormia fimetaria CBS 119925]